MTSTDLAASVLRLCSNRHNLSPEDLYGHFPTVDQARLGETVHELADAGLLLADIRRSDLIDGSFIIINAIRRTSLVGEAWLSQIGGDDAVHVDSGPPPTYH